MGGTFSSSIGGKGANQATAARRAGADVTFLSAIGEDAHGALIRSHFAAEGIETLWAHIPTDIPTGAAMILVDARGENSIAVAPGANEAITPANMAGISFDAYSHVLISLEVPMSVVLEAARIGSAAGCAVILNPAPAAALPDELLRHVRILVPNEHEIAALVPVGDPSSLHERAARRFFELGGNALIVTLGANGAKVIQPAHSEIIPGIPVEAVDTVGAGDCFCGVLAASLAGGHELPDAVRSAHRAASLSVQKRGAISPLPSGRPDPSTPPAT